jgi:AAA+ ATPase superfamily predicted ATPase
MFFGREDDFAYIQKKISGGKKGGLLVLCGSRRSGKTSILFQVHDGRLGAEFFPVLIDMQAMAVENDLDFLIKLGQGIVDAVSDPEISLEKDFIAQPQENSFAKFEKFIVKVNERLEGKKLILLFDEYEIFESHIEKNLISTAVINLLANWIDYKEGAFIVFTGSDRLDERTASYWAGFLPKALYRGVSYLSKRDTIRLIRDPVKDVVQYEEEVPEEIYRLTAGQPFYTQ